MRTSFGYVQCSPDPHQGASAMIVPPLSIREGFSPLDPFNDFPCVTTTSGRLRGGAAAVARYYCWIDV